MNLETIKEIEEQIDYHLETYDDAMSEGNAKVAADCLLVVDSLISQLNGNTINLRTDKVVQ